LSRSLRRQQTPVNGELTAPRFYYPEVCGSGKNAEYFPILPDSLASGRCRILSGKAFKAVKTPIRVKTPIAYPRSKTPIVGD